MNSIFLLLLAFFSFSLVNGLGKLRICIPSKPKNENTNRIQAETVAREAFREVFELLLPSSSKDEKTDFSLDNDVIRAKGYVKNIGLVNEELNITVCTGTLHIPTKLILNEIVIHGDEYYLNGTVADIFYIDGKGTLDIKIEGLTVDLENFFPGWDFCIHFDLKVKLQKWTANFGGIMGGDEVLEPTINDIIGDMGPDIVDFLWNSLYEDLAPIIQQFIDKYINHRDHFGHVDAAILMEGNLNNFEEDKCNTIIIPIKN